jgi:hypothetical protein
MNLDLKKKNWTPMYGWQDNKFGLKEIRYEVVDRFISIRRLTSEGNLHSIEPGDCLIKIATLLPRS